MFFRYIVRYMMNHPELVEKLADSRIMRSAARMAAGSVLRAKGASEDLLARVQQIVASQVASGKPHPMGDAPWSQQPQPKPPLDFPELTKRAEQVVNSSRMQNKASPNPTDYEIQRDLQDKVRQLRELTDELKRKQRG